MHLQIEMEGKMKPTFNFRCVADIKSTTSKIKYYKTKQYSTVKRIGFTTSTGRTKKY